MLDASGLLAVGVDAENLSETSVSSGITNNDVVELGDLDASGDASEGDGTEVDSAARLTVPEITEINTKFNAIQINWTEVDSAVYYLASCRSAATETAPAGEWSDVYFAEGGPVTFEGLTANTTYDLRVKAVSSEHTELTNSMWNNFQVTTDAAPDRLATPEVAVGTATGSTVQLSWNAVEGAVRYIVGFKAQGETDYEVISGITDTSVTIDELDPNTTYDFRVKAVADQETATNSQFTHGEFTTAEFIRLDAPTASVVSSNGALIVSWDAVENADHYIVGYKTADAEDFTVIKGLYGTSAAITNLPSGDYTVRVKAIGDRVTYSNSAFDVMAVSFDASESATEEIPLPDAVYDAETEVLARLATPNATAEVAPTTMTISWDAVEGAVRYIVGYKVEGTDEFTVIKGVTDTSVTIEGLSADTVYNWRVKAVADQETASNSQFVHGSSTTASFTRLATPSVAITVVDGVASVSWDAVENADHYIVGYKATGDEAFTVIRGVADTGVSIEGLQDGEYTIRVKAIGDRLVYSNSAFNVQTITVGEAAFDAEDSAVAPVELPRLATPVATAEVAASTMTLSWDAVEGAVRYIVGYKVEGTDAFVVVKNILDTTVTLEGLSSETVYDWRVKAVADQETASNSQFAHGSSTTATFIRLDAPAAAVVAENGTLAISWDAVENANHYIVGYKAADSEEYTVIKGIYDTSVTVSDLTPGEYDVRVKAIGDRVTYSNSAFDKLAVDLDANATTGEEEIFDVAEDIEFDIDSIAAVSDIRPEDLV